jgi:hypothetical protein
MHEIANYKAYKLTTHDKPCHLNSNICEYISINNIFLDKQMDYLLACLSNVLLYAILTMLAFNQSLIKTLLLLWFLSLIPLSVNAATDLKTFIKTDPDAAAENTKPIKLIIGSVVTLEGQGWIIHSDEKRDPIAVGTPLRQGDSIHTAPQSKVEVRFLDGSSVTVKPSSQINIEQYHWDEKSKSGISILEFIKGAFRAISGLIAKEDPDNYEFKTPVASIGVRGTDFGARSCDQQTCVTQTGNNSLTLSQGVYIGVLDGQIALTSNGSETLVSAGHAVFQKDADSAVKPVQNLPGLIFSAEELKTYAVEARVPYYAAFLLDNSGKPVRDSLGRCIRSSAYRTEHNVTECQ